MATIVKLKNSVTTTAAPTSLVQGEAAINITDKKLWVGNAASGVVQILGAGATVSGTDVAYTGTLTGGTGVVNLGSGQFYKDASGNIGVGTASPAVKLDIAGAAHSTSGFILGTATNGTTGQFATDNTNNYLDYLGSLIFRTAAASVERMRIDSSGNVGIGTNSPAYKLDVAAVLNASVRSVSSATNGYAYFQLENTGGGRAWQVATGGSSSVYNGALGFFDGTAGAERMRIDSSGNLLVGTTSTNPAVSRVNGTNIPSGGGILTRGGNSSSYFSLDVTSGQHMNFYTDNGSSFVLAGNISSNGSITAYNVTSDYRLKQNIAPLQNSLSKVLQLKPCSYNYIEGNQYSEGFIAHELAEIVPQAVTGEKDAVNEDGTIKAQGVDTSLLVATLVSAIQELNAEVQALKQQLGK
jgi:hypothetical protein